jgi:hypothetical protein
MGLLDNLYSSLEDPLKAAQITALAQGLLGPGRSMQRANQGLLGMQAAAARAKAEQEAAIDTKLKRQASELQIQQLLSSIQQDKTNRENEAKFRGLIPSPLMQASSSALADGRGPTIDAADRMPRVDPMEQMQFEAMRLGQIKPLDYINAQRKDDAPLTVAPGAALVRKNQQGGYTSLFTNPKEDATPSAVKEYNFAVSQGYTKSFDQWKHDLAKSGATNVNVKTDVKTGESLAAQVGPMLKASRESAISGLNLVDSAKRMGEALDATGGMYVGPLADVRLKIAQVGDLLGVAGKDTQEKIENTRQVVRGLAEQAVAARSQLGGQAQISNTEQALITKATSAELSDLTPRELRIIVNLSDRLGRQLHGRHQEQLSVIKNRPDLQQLEPFYAVPQLGEVRTPKKAMSDLPAAAVHKGKIIVDKQTGQKYISNGIEWVPQ